MSQPERSRRLWLAALVPVLIAGVLAAVLEPAAQHVRAATWVLLIFALAVALFAAGFLAWWSVRQDTHFRASLLRQVERSEQLRAEALARLGAALAGTHDLERILAVTLDAAMASVQASAGAVFLTLSSGEELALMVGRGLEQRLPVATRATGRISARPPAGTGFAAPPQQAAGVIARVARTGDRVLAPGAAEALLLAQDEPQADAVLALPLRSGGRVTGVIALYDPVRPDSAPGPAPGSAPGSAPDSAPGPSPEPDRERRPKHRHGSQRPARGPGRFQEEDADRVAGFLSRAELAVDNVLSHQETQRLSITDGLTGLWNYRYASLALNREVERASRFVRPLAVLMLDLDRFKRVNDMFGHQRGDAVLAEVARRVRTVIRDIDILARYGGEELVLLLPETDEQGAVYLAGRVMDAVRGQPMGEPGEAPLRMTCSIGIALLPQHGRSPAALLRAADRALYAAKAAGRDRCLLADDVRAPEPEHSEPPPAPASAPEPGPGNIGRSVLDLDADPPRTVLEMGWQASESVRPSQPPRD